MAAPFGPLSLISMAPQLADGQGGRAEYLRLIDEKLDSTLGSIESVAHTGAMPSDPTLFLLSSETNRMGRSRSMPGRMSAENSSIWRPAEPGRQRAPDGLLRASPVGRKVRRSQPGVSLWQGLVLFLILVVEIVFRLFQDFTGARLVAAGHHHLDTAQAVHS